MPIGGKVTKKGIEWTRVLEADLVGKSELPRLQPDDLNWSCLMDMVKLGKLDRDEWMKMLKVLWIGDPAF